MIVSPNSRTLFIRTQSVFRVLDNVKMLARTNDEYYKFLKERNNYIKRWNATNNSRQTSWGKRWCCSNGGLNLKVFKRKVNDKFNIQIFRNR